MNWCNTHLTRLKFFHSIHIKSMQQKDWEPLDSPLDGILPVKSGPVISCLLFVKRVNQYA